MKNTQTNLMLNKIHKYALKNLDINFINFTKKTAYILY